MHTELLTSAIVDPRSLLLLPATLADALPRRGQHQIERANDARQCAGTESERKLRSELLSIRTAHARRSRGKRAHHRFA
jgi:hypothetical protein